MSLMPLSHFFFVPEKENPFPLLDRFLPHCVYGLNTWLMAGNWDSNDDWDEESEPKGNAWDRISESSDDGEGLTRDPTSEANRKLLAKQHDVPPKKQQAPLDMETVECESSIQGVAFFVRCHMQLPHICITRQTLCIG